MTKKTRVRDYDQFIVRLPPGMRQRIKAKADGAGMSMNEAVVWALDRTFPAPTTIDEKISELIDLVATLKGDDSYHMVDKLVDEISDTLDKVSNYRIRSRPSFRDKVKDRYEQILQDEYDRAQAEDYAFENPPEDDGVPFPDPPKKD